MDILPNRLKSGQVLKYNDMELVVSVTTERDEFDEPLYRLVFNSGVKGNSRYTRDELQDMGCVLVEGGGK